MFVVSLLSSAIISDNLPSLSLWGWSHFCLPINISCLENSRNLRQRLRHGQWYNICTLFLKWTHQLRQETRKNSKKVMPIFYSCLLGKPAKKHILFFFLLSYLSTVLCSFVFVGKGFTVVVGFSWKSSFAEQKLALEEAEDGSETLFDKHSDKSSSQSTHLTTLSNESPCVCSFPIQFT